jgi:hypothetical protein
VQKLIIARQVLAAHAEDSAKMTSGATTVREA